MRDIFLLTNEKPTWERCKCAILEEYPGAQGNKSGVFIGKSPFTIQIWFESDGSDRMYNDNDGAAGFPEELRELVPMQNPFCTNVEFHTVDSVKRIVCLLLNLFPEMYIIDDDDNVLSAADYLEIGA